MQNLAKLYYLYNAQMFGEEFCDDLAPTPKQPNLQEQNLGYNPVGAKIGFITQSPLIDRNHQFLSKKSAQMLENIINNVFHLSKNEYCIFSLFKSYSLTPQNLQELPKYQEILKAQILQSQAQVFVIFGNEEVAQHLLNTTHPIGTLFKFGNKQLLITHPFNALIKRDTFKKETFTHLKLVKNLLANLKES